MITDNSNHDSDLQTFYNKKNDTQNFHPPVNNCPTNHSTNPSRYALMKISEKIIEENPLEDIIWPSGVITINSYFFYRILVLLLHIIPAIFIDGLLRIASKIPRMFWMDGIGKISIGIFFIRNMKYVYNTWRSDKS